MTPHTLKGLQDRIAYRFVNLSLLKRALTHRSFSSDHNERLEFLGDSVLSLSVATLLYEQLAGQNEGDLSRVRANLVRQETLHMLANQLALSDLIALGEGESKSGGKKRPSILADALEAIIGAVYLDGGYDAASKVVLHLFREVKVDNQMQAMGKDAKTALQEWLQGKKLLLPTYKVVGTHGQAHQQTFEVECSINGSQQTFTARGNSRRAAEQAAATLMLDYLKTKK